MSISDKAGGPHHHRRAMSGRDPHEAHRVATPLELLFDLTFVIAFGVAANGLAHALGAHHYAAGLIGFTLSGFALCLAWTNFTWFASAYDTDDWAFRLATMVQMCGVLIVAIGIPRLFASIEHGAHLDLGTMVGGYVVMRLALVFQWLRVAREDPGRRAGALTYAGLTALLQLGWIAMIPADLPLGPAIAMFCVLGVAEMIAPEIAEGRCGGTPWHAHHIVERHSLFAIIALGEGVVGTVAALSAVIDVQGWTLDAALICIAGMGLTFSLWWIYYMLPSGDVLHRHRERGFVWAWTQLAVIVAIVGIGAGLHVAATYIEGKAQIGPLATLLTVAVPVGIFLGMVYGLYAYMLRRFDPFHVWLLSGTALVLAAAIWAGAAGLPMTWCLIILTFAPLVTVVGYECRGYRHQRDALAQDRT
jgi:low temperature requirement protein LtrA